MTKKMKVLKINGVVFAKYEVKHGMLFLQVITPMHETDNAESEDMIVRIIQVVEKCEFGGVGYLNI